MQLYDVLVKPVVTEKSERLRAENCYVFEVSSRANKILVKQAVKKIFGVTPRRVNILNTSDKLKRNRFGMGVKSGYKKAYVFLAKNDKIQLFEGV